MIRRAAVAKVAAKVMRKRLLTLGDSPCMGNLSRAGGACICEECHLSYADHPTHPVETYATMLCDGTFVKL